MTQTLRRGCALLAVLLIVAACAQTKPVKSTHTVVSWPAGERRLLVMEADIELGLITTGGVVEPRADWTEAAERHVDAELDRYFAAKTIEAVGHNEIPGFDDNPRHAQLRKLFSAVAGAVVTHQYSNGLKLPHKRGALDWTLGSGVQSLRDASGAQYALFLTLRDTYSSAGRVALALTMALLFGAVPQGGSQIGYAALVDLNSGRLVWFNIFADAAGDLRERSGAAEAVNNLLDELPL